MKHFIIIIAILFVTSQALTAKTDPNNPTMTEEQSHRTDPNTPSDHPAQNVPDKQEITPELEARIHSLILENAETFYDNKFDSLQVSLGIYVTIVLAMGGLFGIVIGVVVPFILEYKRSKGFDRLAAQIEKQKADLQDQMDEKIKKAYENVLEAVTKDINKTKETLKEHNDKALQEMKCRNSAPFGRVFAGLAQAFEGADNIPVGTICGLEAVYQFLIAKQYRNAENYLSISVVHIESIIISEKAEEYWTSVKRVTKQIESDCDLKGHAEIKKLVEKVSQWAIYNLVLLSKKTTEDTSDDAPSGNPGQ